MTARNSKLNGKWYPDDPEEIKNMLKTWIRKDIPNPGRVITAMVPHAGWIFSGQLATQTIYQATSSYQPDLVVVLGGHLPPGVPIIAYDEDFWETPLGPLPIAKNLNQSISDNWNLKIWSGPTPDNTIEVQLPIIKYLCPQARIWPLQIPADTSAISLGQKLSEMFSPNSSQTLIISSTDLTHYGQSYGFMPAGGGRSGEEYRRKNDQAFIQAALEADTKKMLLLGTQAKAACSSGAAAAGTEAATISGAKGISIGYMSSSDVMPGEQSVGYSGIIYAIND